MPVTPSNFDSVGRARDHMTNTSAVDAVLKVGGREQRRRRRHDDAKLDRGEQRFPERHFVAEHQHQAVAPSCAEVAQEVGDAIRCRRQFRERADRLGAVLFDDVQGGTIVAGGDRIEVVERPVEVLLARPLELADGRVVIGPVLQNEIAAGEKRGSGAGVIHREPRGPSNAGPRSIRRPRVVCDPVIVQRQERGDVRSSWPRLTRPERVA